MENLNKENFWNELHSQCPTAVAYFCDWIDRYKTANNWNELFGEAVKFHHLPFEMQNRIIAAFELELYNNTAGNGKHTAEAIMENYKITVVELFRDLQKNIDNRSIMLN